MRKERMAPSVPADADLRKELRDPVIAAELLNAAAAEDDPADFLFALRKVAEANGGIGSIARRTKLNRQQLYKTLSSEGNPEFRTLRAILAAAGFSLTVVPKETLKDRKSGPQAVRNRRSGARFTARSAAARRRLPEPGAARQA